MLDKIDRKLLSLLQSDCTLSLQALADAVNLTTTPCWKRLKKLEDDGILLGRVALLDPETGAWTDRLRPDKNAASQQRMVQPLRHPCFRHARGARLLAHGGEYDYLMRVQVADMKRYDDFYKRLVNSVPGLSDVTSSFAMEQIKYTTALPIE